MANYQEIAEAIQFAKASLAEGRISQKQADLAIARFAAEFQSDAIEGLKGRLSQMDSDALRMAKGHQAIKAAFSNAMEAHLEALLPEPALA